jgi:multidrug efflux pump subunit AcrB
MIAITVAGLASYFRLGRNEDPAFTFRTMIVQAAWPGATLDDTLNQVTERLERKLQETNGLDFLHSSPPADGRPSMHETVLQSFGVVGIEVGLLLGARKPVS